MFLNIQFKSGKPVYRQIVDQVKYALAMNRLRPGDQLPSIRALAEQLRINRNTVSKAYSELEHEGVVETRHGKGVFCREIDSPLGEEARREILSRAIDAAIVQAHHFDVDRQTFHNMVDDRFREFETKRMETPTQEED